MPHPRPLRSLLMATTALFEDGGIAVVSRCIARAFDEAVAERRLTRVDRVSLLDREGSPGPLQGEQHLAKGHQSAFVWHAWNMVLRHRPDLVLVDHVGVGRTFRLPLPPLRRPRLAVFVHGRELDGVRGRLRESVIREADLILTNSLHTADAVRDRFPDVSQRIRPVVLCIDPGLVGTWESLGDEPVERELAVLFVGRLWPNMPGKGHDTLLDAWPRVLAALPGAELWIAGAGDDRGRLEAKARTLGIPDAVRFLGRISDEDLSRRYRRAALFAMPSRQEGFGLVYAEAMWHGCPAIGSTSDAAGEVIRDGETGVLVPYGDPDATAATLIELLKDPERRRRMGEAGARDARERFGYARFREDLYRALEIS